MKHFTIDTAPPMSNGLMIAALSGPQDVAQSSTIALKHLMKRDEAVTFAQADPDGLFIYNTFTPSLKRDQESGLVTIVWPQLELHHAGPGDEPGPVFLTGWRPQIGMHGLIDDLGEIAEMCGVRNMIHLTSGYGEQPHTRPTIISALATTPHKNPELYEIMMSLGAEPNAVPLEDPVLVQACLVKDMGYLSICGHVSRYLSMIPDYQVAADLARSIQQFTRSAGKPLLDLEQQESEFRKTVEEAVANNPALASVVLAAEQAESERENQMETGLGDINPEEMALEVEQFLRAERENDKGSMH